MKLVFLDAETLGNVSNLGLFNQFGDYTQYATTSQEELFPRCADADIIITNKVVFTKEVLEQLPKLKLLCLTATGMNNVDLEYAQSNNILVKNVAGYSTESVVQVSVSMVLSLITRLSYYDEYVKSGKYQNQPLFTHIGAGFWQLKGKRVGIIGMGNIGSRMAEIMQAFGCEVVYYSTSGKNNQSKFTRVELDELLATSKVVSIHAPLNDKTKNLISLKELQQMSSDAILVNAGRGGIVNETDLVEAINENYIAGAGIDVFEKEPIIKDSPFLKCLQPDKLILAPHIAWASIEARTQLVEMVCDNIKEYKSLTE